MNNEFPQPVKKDPVENTTLTITLIIGILLFLFSCALAIGAAYTDINGLKAIGKVSNDSKNCPPGKGCWTGKVDFTTKNGEQISFYPKTLPFFFDMDFMLSDRPYPEFSLHEVRYLEEYPQYAKVKLALYFEYFNFICGMGFGVFLFFIGILSRSTKSGKAHKPIVIDLRNWRK